MKLQNMTVIFSIIIIPVTLILSAYIGTQIDTASLQQSYDTKLMDATHDAVISFELNTANSEYTTNADSIRRDIQASVNSFFTCLASNLGTPGASSSSINPYIPAIVFTLYDGYYIYAPNEAIYEENGETKTKYEHILKPYVHYSARYVKGQNDLVVNYSLDNYITIYGNVGGEYISKSGYLIDTSKVSPDGTRVNGITITKENLKEIIAVEENNTVVRKEFAYKYINNKKVYKDEAGWFTVNNLKKLYLSNINQNEQLEDDSAIKYYKEALNFTSEILSNSQLLDTVRPNNAIRSDGQKYNELKNDNTRILAVGSNNNPEELSSVFTQHKREIMRNSIQENLNNAMMLYSMHTEKSNTFSMPILTSDDWEKLLTNINIISFMQGLPVGNTLYNNYAIITSTNNKQFINPKTLYFISERQYHKINCEQVQENNQNLVGYKSADFKLVKDTSNNSSYYRHTEYACYTCIVNSLNEQLQVNNLSDNKKRAFYSALARERYNLDRVTKMLENKI